MYASQLFFFFVGFLICKTIIQGEKHRYLVSFREDSFLLVDEKREILKEYGDVKKVMESLEIFSMNMTDKKAEQLKKHKYIHSVVKNREMKIVFD